LGTIGLIELLQMNNALAKTKAKYMSILFLWFILIPAEQFQFIKGIQKPEVMIIFIMLLLAYTVLKKNTFTFDDAGFLLIATIYVGIGFLYLIEARMAGLNYVLFVLFIIWGTDTGAYCFGRAIGKRKLWPTISPNKTIEGAVGGVLIAVVIGFIFQLVYPFTFTMLTVVGVAILVSVVGQIGDLVASGYKRNYN